MKLQTMRMLAVAVVGVAGASSVLGQSIYIGPAAGAWGTAANWSLGVPGPGLDARINNAASIVDVQINAVAAVNHLAIDAGDTVSINNGQRLSIFGNVVNNGVLKLNTVNAFTYLQPTGTVTFGGTGAIELADTTTSLEGYFYDNTNANAANDHIINGTAHTIRGRGFIGFSTTTQITNNNLIDASVAGSNLTLSPNAAGLTNNGLLRASNGGFLVLDGANGAFTNTTASNVIEAQGGTARVNLIANARITGGTLSGAGSFVVPAGNRGIYNTLVHNTTTSVTNSGRLDLVGTIVNNGVIRLDTVNSFTYLQPSGTVNLTGTGTIELADTSSSVEGYFYDNTNANAANDHIINGVNHTIRGRGFIGFTTTTQITNNGLIVADQAASRLTVTPNASGLINTSILRATNGGDLALDGGNVGNVFTNTAATIEAQTGSTVTLINLPRVVGGTLAGAGSFGVPAGQRAILESLTNNSTVVVTNSGRMDLVGAIVNNGVIRLDTINVFTYLQPSGTVNLNGTGAIELADTTTSAEGYFYDNTNANSATDHIINGSSHTIRGIGFVGFSTSTRITNNGTITANFPGGLLTLLPNASGMTNNGTLRATAGGILSLDEGEAAALYSGSGTLVVDAGSVIQATAGAGGALGAVTGAGTVRAVGNNITLSFQSIRTGAIDASGAGIVKITAGGGNVGTSAVSAITLAGNGKVDLTDHGLIVEYASASPAPSVRTQLAAGRAGGLWNGNNGIGSSLANNNGFAVGYGEASDLGITNFLGVVVDPTTVLIRYTRNGDATLDGTVAFADLLILAQNYNATSAVWSRGDFDYDGTVGFSDLLAIAQNFNLSVIQLSPGEQAMLNDVAGQGFAQSWELARSMVPEPTTLSIAAGAVALMMRRRR